MVVPTQKNVRLKKEMTLLGVYSVATGATLSAGFFLLPGIAAKFAGNAIVLSYLIAAIPLVPAMFSIMELGSAMPRAGGMYYFLDRTLGPMFGTIGGIGTWFALILKVSFALVGMGAYISLFIPGVEITPIAVAIAMILCLVNLFGAKKSISVQKVLVLGLLLILGVFIGGGSTELDYSRLSGIFDHDINPIIYTAGLVYISYVGVTNVASLSEEIKDPEKNIPRGILLAMGTAVIIYGLGTLVMVGVVPMNELAGSLTPVALVGEKVFGTAGVVVFSFAALLAFTSVANAGTMSASRYPMAMSRDHILPRSFALLSKQGTPYVSIIITSSVIILILLLLNPTGIAKLASSFQLLMFAMICLAVIVIRESRIEAYDPGYKSPFYPWMQLAGIFSSLYLIVQMGFMPILFSCILILCGGLWYWYYAREKVVRNGAIYHIFERLGKLRYEGLETELREILIEKGLRHNDPFDEIIARSSTLDIEEECEFTDILDRVSQMLESKVHISCSLISKELLNGTRIGATPVTHGIALPHFRSKNIDHAEMVLVRAHKGLHICFHDRSPDTAETVDHKVFGLFFLVSPENNPTQHLRILAQIAARVDEKSFMEHWLHAKNEQKLKEALLSDEHFVSLRIDKDLKTSNLINKEIKDLNFPLGCLIALLRRNNEIIVPKGNTTLLEGDRLTVLGDPKSLDKLRKKYLEYI